MMICLYAIERYIDNKKCILFIINVGFASLFHSSAWISMLVIMANFFKYNKFILYSTLSLSMVFFFIDVKPYLVESGFLSFSRFESYLYNAHYNELSTSLGSIIRYLFKTFIIFPIFFLNKKYFEDNTVRYNIVLWMNSLLVIVLVMSFNFYILHRVVLFLSMFVVCSTILLIDSKYKYKSFLFCIYIALNIIVYEYFVFSETFYDDAPYRTILDRLS